MNKRLSRKAVFYALWVLALVGQGCAMLPHGASSGAPAIEQIRMEPLYFELDASNTLDAYDAEALFERGNKAFDAGEWQQAYDAYTKLIAEFEDSPWVPSALYNGGLCLDRLKEYARATTFFTSIVESYAKSPLKRNALWNLVDLSEKSQNWPETQRWLSLLEQGVGQDPAEQVEIGARKAIAEAMQRPSDDTLELLDEQAIGYRRALLLYPYLSRAHLARLHFTAGEILLSRMQSVPLLLPQDVLELNLQVKAEWLLRSQDAYMKAIKAQDPHWATASVYRIGFLYEDFYDALLSAPVPPDLDEQKLAVYREELIDTLKPVKRKAKYAYKRIIDFSRRLALDSEWVARAEKHLAALKKFEASTAVMPDESPRDNTDVTK